MDLVTLLMGVLLPGGIGGLIALWSRVAGTGARAAAVGVMVGVLAIDDLPAMPPVEAPDYLPILALIGLVWGQLQARLLTAAPLRLLVALLLLWPITTRPVVYKTVRSCTASCRLTTSRCMLDVVLLREMSAQPAMLVNKATRWCLGFVDVATSQ